MSVRRGARRGSPSPRRCCSRRAGCAETRGKESVGAYVDDASITSTVKSRMVEDKAVDADAIQVETANGNVVLSGVAQNAAREEHRRKHRHEGPRREDGAEQRRAATLTERPPRPRRGAAR